MILLFACTGSLDDTGETSDTNPKDIERTRELSVTADWVTESLGYATGFATTDINQDGFLDVVISYGNDMDLNDKLLRGIYGHGYERPSAIQQKAIIPFCSGRDIIAQAQSGTGKTATFTIGILSRLDLIFFELIKN